MATPERFTPNSDGLYMYRGAEDLYEQKPYFSLTGRVALKIYEGVAALPDECVDQDTRTITLGERDSLPMPVPAYSEFLLHTTTYQGAALQVGRRLSEIVADNTEGQVFEAGQEPRVVVQTFSEHDPDFTRHPKFKFNLSLEEIGASKLIWATFGRAWETISMPPKAMDELAPTPWSIVWQDTEAKHVLPVVSPAFLLFMEATAQKLNGSSPEVIAEFQSTLDALRANPLWAEDTALAKERYNIFMQSVREKYPQTRDIRSLLGKRSILAVVHSGKANAQLWRSQRKNTSE
jgi:hypothetical protein